jgi:hypothetical protein
MAALANAMAGHADETDDLASRRPLPSRLRHRAGGIRGRRGGRPSGAELIRAVRWATTSARG